MTSRHKLILATALIASAPAIAQSNKREPSPALPTPAMNLARCEGLSADYEIASKKLALSAAENAADNSAPRAAMRAAQDANIYNEARMTMDLMKSTGCSLPDYVPSSSRYTLASNQCATALLKHNEILETARQYGIPANFPLPDACNIDRWTLTAR